MKHLFIFTIHSSLKINYWLICIYFLILTLNSCSKSPNNSNNYININPPTGNYYSTVFCNINDSNWYDCSFGGALPGWKSSGVISDYYTNSGGRPLQIQANNSCDSYYQGILIYMIPFQGIGKYNLNKKGFGSYAGGSFWSGNPSDLTRGYETNFDYNGIVEITEFDTIKRVLSGSFYFDALYSDSNQVAKITKGTLVKVKYN